MSKSHSRSKSGILTWICALALAIVCMIASAEKVNADTGMIPLALDDSWISGEISVKDEADLYRVSLTEAGWLTVTCQTWSLGDGRFIILSEDMAKEYCDTYVGSSTSISPETSDETLAMEPGTYVIKVIGSYSDSVGDYKLKASFKAAGNNENSDNNDFGTAQALTFDDKVTGFLSEDDKADFYKINLTSKKTIRLIYTGYISDSYMEIYNEDYISVEKVNTFYASESSPKTDEYEATLEPGTYFIKVYPYGNDTGRYVIQYKEKVMVKSLKITGKSMLTSGQSTKLKATISPGNASVKTVKWMSSDTWVASVDSESGRVTTSRPGVVKITALAQDGSNKQKVYTIIVKPKKITDLKISNYSKRQLYISYSLQYGATGYQIQCSANKNFSDAKSKKVTGSYVTFKGLKSKNKYYVRVRGFVKKGGKYYYGNWSVVKSKKVL